MNKYMATLSFDDDSASHDDLCSLGKEVQDEQLICMRSYWGGNIVVGSSSNIIDGANGVSLATSTSQVTPKPFSSAIRKICENNCDSAEDAYELLWEYIEDISPKVSELDKIKKHSKQLEDGFASKTNELNETTTKFQELKIEVDKLDPISSESLDKQNVKAKKKDCQLRK